LKKRKVAVQFGYHISDNDSITCGNEVAAGVLCGAFFQALRALYPSSPVEEEEGEVESVGCSEECDGGEGEYDEEQDQLEQHQQRLGRSECARREKKRKKILADRIREEDEKKYGGRCVEKNGVWFIHRCGNLLYM
jgi:hypothetical protein